MVIHKMTRSNQRASGRDTHNHALLRKCATLSRGQPGKLGNTVQVLEKHATKSADSAGTAL